MPAAPLLSVVLIACNEEANLRATLPTLAFADEVLLVDSGSQDGTVALAEALGARVLHLPWQGFGAQKNAALAAAAGDWILSLDADEAVPPALADEISRAIRRSEPNAPAAYLVPRSNFFLGRPLCHGGLLPDPKLRLARRGVARWQDRAVHESMYVLDSAVRVAGLQTPLQHHAYPTLDVYLEHLRRYSALASNALAEQGRAPRGWPELFRDAVLNPVATFIYNYGLRLGFLDGLPGLLYHLFHSVYVAEKYARAWEQTRARQATPS